MSTRKKLILTSCVIGIVAYFFFWRILGAGLWAMSLVLSAKQMEVVGIVLSPLALPSMWQDKRLIAEATELPPADAVERLRELIREYPPEETLSRSHWGLTVRRSALDALGAYSLQLQATAVHEMVEAFAAGDGSTAYAAQCRLVEIGKDAEPAIPMLVEIVNSSESHWHREHAANILSAIAFDLQDAFPNRSRAVWVLGQRLNQADTDPSRDYSDFAQALAAIDPQGEDCLPYLIRGLSSTSHEIRQTSFGALTSIAERNHDVQKWLDANGDMDLSMPFKGTEFPPREQP